MTNFRNPIVTAKDYCAKAFGISDYDFSEPDNVFLNSYTQERQPNRRWHLPVGPLVGSFSRRLTHVSAGSSS